MRYRYLYVYRKVSRTYKVFILTKDDRYFQEYSMTIKYMNRFAIEEDDQFEIHVKDYSNEKYPTDLGEYIRRRRDEIYNAAKEVMLKLQKGSGYYR